MDLKHVCSSICRNPALERRGYYSQCANVFSSSQYFRAFRAIMSSKRIVGARELENAFEKTKRKLPNIAHTKRLGLHTRSIMKYINTVIL